MPAGRFLALMYHELGEAGRTPCSDDPGYLRYVVSRENFRVHLGLIAESGARGQAIGAILAGGEANPVGITFDDGAATDLEIAARLLSEQGFGATFFIVPAFLGRPGYLSPGGVRALHEEGFEIGSHGMTHRFLTSLAPAELAEELIASRRTLEELTGAPVRHLSCPGGRWSRQVATAAGAAGYASLSTSAVGWNALAGDRFALARLAIRSDLGHDGFRRRLQGGGLGRDRFRARVLGSLRAALGDGLYDSLQRRFGG